MHAQKHGWTEWKSWMRMSSVKGDLGACNIVGEVLAVRHRFSLV